VTHVYHKHLDGGTASRRDTQRHGLVRLILLRYNKPERHEPFFVHSHCSLCTGGEKVSEGKTREVRRLVRVRPAHTRMADLLAPACTELPGSRSRHVASLLEEARAEPPGSRSRHQQNPCPEFTCVATWYQGWNGNSTKSRSHCATREEKSVRTPAGNMTAACGTTVAQTYTQLAAAAAHMHTQLAAAAVKQRCRGGPALDDNEAAKDGDYSHLDEFITAPDGGHSPVLAGGIIHQQVPPGPDVPPLPIQSRPGRSRDRV